MDTRISKAEYYLLMAKDVALRSSCTRKKFGAILVRNDTIISTGYNGSVRDATNCGIDCPCLKDLHGEASMVSYDHCPAVHAEMNVIINAARSGITTLGATMFLSEEKRDGGESCFLCRRFMIQAGITDCYYTIIINGEVVINHTFYADWIKQENSGILLQEQHWKVKKKMRKNE